MRVITIGRGSDNDIIITDSKVSRNHLQIVQNNEGYFSIVDLNSTNGTYVNGKRITGEVRINPGDQIKIGNTILPWKTYFQTESPKASVSPVNSSTERSYKKLLWISAAIIVLMVIIGGIVFYEIYQKREEMNKTNTQIIENQIVTADRDAVAVERDSLLKVKQGLIDSAKDAQKRADTQYDKIKLKADEAEKKINQMSQFQENMTLFDRLDPKDQDNYFKTICKNLGKNYEVPKNESARKFLISKFKDVSIEEEMRINQIIKNVFDNDINKKLPVPKPKITNKQ